LPDYLDIDADNDGIPDNIEGQTTSGWVAPSGVGTGITDVNNNGVDDNYEDGALVGLNPINTDGADNPDYQDSDADNDGIDDIAENGGGVPDTLSGSDDDGDGLDNNFDENNDTGNGFTVNDNHNPPNPGNLGDEDSDFVNGGNVDYRDIFGEIDTDNDGIPDSTDLDDDNDGILDTEEGENCPLTTFISLGQTFTQASTGTTNGSSASATVNNLYSFDGVTASFAFQLTNSATWNSGVASAGPTGGVDGNYVNIQPQNTVFPSGTTYPTDAASLSVGVYTLTFSEPVSGLEFKWGGLDNSDRTDFSASLNGANAPLTVVNNNIAAGEFTIAGQSVVSPTTSAGNAPSNSVIVSSSGLLDEIVFVVGKENSSVGNITLQLFELTYCTTTDTDGDGIPNSLDLDSDNDGIPDVIESGGIDADRDGRADGTVGTAGGTLGVPSSAGTGNTPTNSDFDTIPDYLDIDADNDGIPDNIEGQPSKTYVAPSGIGNGITDANNNGVDDNYETGGFVGLDPENTDGTDNPDYTDLDSDNDFIDDIAENGNANNVVSGTDTDGDGLDDNFDDNDDSGISGSTVNDGINPPSPANLGDEDNDFNSIGDLDYRDVGANGVPMITQVYQFNDERWIEVTNVSKTASVNPNFIKVLLFKDRTGDQTGILPDASFTLGNTLAPGQSVLFRNSNNPVRNTTAAAPTPNAIVIENNNLTDIEGANDIVILSNFTDITSWVNRFDVVQEFDNKTSFVRIDERLTPNDTYTPSEWVVFIDDAIPIFGAQTTPANDGRHPHDPLISEITGSDTDANTLLGLHRVDVTTRTGGVWNNGIPDRSRFVIVDEDLNQTTGRLSARKLTVNDSRKLGITNNLLVVTNEVVINGEVRLIDTSGASRAQLIQTHTSASLVTADSDGKLLVDQNSAVPSLFRYNYIGSPVKNASGSTTYTIASILKDGTTPTNFDGVINQSGASGIAKDINFIGGFDGNFTNSPTNAISLADYWMYTFAASAGGRASWIQTRSGGDIANTDGFIFKGPGRPQNYTFLGVPKDGTITTTVGGSESYLLANPYPSAISAKEFIEDNIDATTGILYFWRHASEADTDSKDTSGHNFSGYIGGYATRTINVGVAAKDANLNNTSSVVDFNFQAESNSAITNGVKETVEDSSIEGSNNMIGIVKLQAALDSITFRNNAGNVDSLRIRYSSTVEKILDIKVDNVQRTSITLPSTGGDFNIIASAVCVVIASDVTLLSNDSNEIEIDYLNFLNSDGSAVSCSATSGNALFLEPEPYIPIGQGFFVGGDVDGGTIEFNNSQREYKIEEPGSSVFFKSSSKSKKTGGIPVLKLGIDFNEFNDVYHRQIAVSFNSFNSFDYEKGYDAEIFDLGATDMYWKFPEDDRKYVIAGVQSISSDLEIPLEIIIADSGSVSIMIDESKNLNHTVYLLDKVTGLSYELEKDKATLSLETGTYTDRFVLSFQPIEVLSTEEITSQLTNMFIDNQSREVVVTKTGDISVEKVALYNLLGKQIESWNIDEQKESYRLKVNRKLPMGVYIIKLNSKEGEYNKKVIIE
jgi:hypothetical protein